MQHEAKRVALLALAVAVVTAVWLWPATRGSFLNWDDDIYLAELQKQPGIVWVFSTLRPFYYHPLTWLSYFFDQRVAGLDPLQFHATNVLLHAANAGLVVLLATTLLGSTGKKLITAGFIGLVFGLHPLNVEPVAWIAERKTLLCALFAFSALCVYLRGRRWMATGLFACAVLSKPAAVSLPVVLLAFDFYPLKRSRLAGWRPLIREKWLMLVFAAASAVATMAAVRYNRSIMSAEAHDLCARTLTAAHGFAFYLWKLAWPAWLSPFYPLTGGIKLSNAVYAGSVALFIAVTVIAVAVHRRLPALLPAWIAYLAMVLPSSGFVQVGSQATADRYAYLAMPAVLLAGGVGVIELCRRFSRVGRVAFIVLAGAWCLYLAQQTWQQLPVWHDTETMWRAVLRHYPRSGTANAQLAAELVRQERFDDAAPFAELGYELRPEHPSAQWALEQLCLHRAEQSVEQRDYTGALRLVSRAVDIAPTDAFAHSGFGAVLLKMGDSAKAVAELEAAVRLDARLPAAQYNLASSYARLGRIDDARAALKRAIALRPESAELAARDVQLSALLAADRK